jgi:hypothetical protein
LLTQSQDLSRISVELKSSDNITAEAELKVDGENSDPEIRSQPEDEAVVID